MEWKKAGGQLLAQQKQQEQPKRVNANPGPSRNQTHQSIENYAEPYLLEALSSLVWKLFD
jgi:hypothetical protein